jgi:hypothetical protein
VFSVSNDSEGEVKESWILKYPIQLFDSEKFNNEIPGKMEAFPSASQTRISHTFSSRDYS